MSAPRTEADWLDMLLGPEKSGDHLRAYDVAREAIAQHPDNPELRYRAVLALARCGATTTAIHEFAALGLDRGNPKVASLRARLGKDMALRNRANPALARESAELYAKVADATGDSYPGINAATMFLLAGDKSQSEARAVQSRSSLYSWGLREAPPRLYHFFTLSGRPTGRVVDAANSSTPTFSTPFRGSAGVARQMGTPRLR